MPLDSTAQITVLPDAREQWDATKDSEAEKGFFVKVDSTQPTSLMRFPVRESAMSRYSGILRIQLPYKKGFDDLNRSGAVLVSVARNEPQNPEWIAALKIPLLVIVVIVEIASWLKGSKTIRVFLSESTNFARALGSQNRLLDKTKQIQTIRFVWLILNLLVCLLENALRTREFEDITSIIMSFSTLILAIYLQNAVISSPILRDRYLLIISGILSALVILICNSDLPVCLDRFDE